MGANLSNTSCDPLPYIHCSSDLRIVALSPGIDSMQFCAAHSWARVKLSITMLS